MEYLEGRSLTDLLDKRAAVSPMERSCRSRARSPRASARRTLASIVHRDLKPDNVFLVDRDGRANFVKILDFGIAKVGSFQSKITRAGEIFGTPHYMAPEQAKGAAVDHRADIYALGVMLVRDAHRPRAVRCRNAVRHPDSAHQRRSAAGRRRSIRKRVSGARSDRDEVPREETRASLREHGGLIEEIDRIERG